MQVPLWDDMRKEPFMQRSPEEIYLEQVRSAKYLTMKDGAKIAYEEFGSGEKYIFSMHMNHQPGKYLEYFADYGYHVIHLWNRSSGPSEPDSPDFSPNWYDRWAEDVIEAANQFGAERFIYTGGSHGAGTGWHLLWQHQERVSAFIALVAGPHALDGSTTNFKAIVEANPNVDFSNFPTGDEGALKRRKLAGAYVKANQDCQSHYNYGKPMCALGSEEKLCEVLKTFRVPTLLIGGLEDMIATPNVMLRTAKCLPNCKLVLYSGAGHSAPMTEIVEEIMFESVAFLENVQNNSSRVYRKIKE